MDDIRHVDIVDIDLDKGNVHRSFLKHSIGSGDTSANRFGVRVFRAGVAVALIGATCQGFFHNANGENIALTSHGTVNGNEAYVTLPQACYNYEGCFSLAIKLVGGGVTGTMRIVDGMVDNTNTGGAVAPTGAVPTYQEVLALYNDVLGIDETAMINRGVGETQSCDDITEEGIYFCSQTQGVKSIGDFPYDAGWLIVTNIGDQTVQYAIEWAEKPSSLIRERMHEVWKEWCPASGNAFDVTRTNIIYSTDPVSADDITSGGVYFSSGSGGTGGITDMPFATGWLIVSQVLGGNPLYLQIAYPYHSTDEAYYRVCNIDGVWGSWREMGSGGGGTTIENTYNITCSPQITTDSNGWLQAEDTDTQSESGKTDMTAAIMTMLNSTGYCHLGPGIFYVSGNIDMPEGSKLEGCGEDTIIRLLQSVSTGYCVRVGKYCTVKDIKFSGGYSSSAPSSATLGTRNAIICIANADGEEADQPIVEPNLITGCWFEGFSGSAVYQHNTGGGVRGAITMSDCFIRHCGAGINIDYYSEYCKYNHIITEQCYYACINNGGNNVFTGCTFHGTIGFLMDNSDGDAANPAHGSCIGCTFNHIDNWNHPADLGGGDAVKVISNPHGFLFDGCQFWYSAVKIKNSRGMTFTGCLFGGNSPVIKVEGSYGAFFNGCTFQNAPSLEVNSATKMDNCYLAADSSAVTP